MALGFVRPARPEDAAEIARIQLTTWRTAYRKMMPRHVFEEINEEMLRERWLEAMTAPPSPGHRVLIAIEQADQDYSVGFLASEPAEITEMLVEPRWGRRGHGSRLLAATVDLWRTDGHTEAVVWRFEQDIASTKFLVSAGWAPDASRSLDVDDLLVPQVRFQTSLKEVAEADGETGALDH